MRLWQYGYSYNIILMLIILPTAYSSFLRVAPFSTHLEFARNPASRYTLDLRPELSPRNSTSSVPREPKFVKKTGTFNIEKIRSAFRKFWIISRRELLLPSTSVYTHDRRNAKKAFLNAVKRWPSDFWFGFTHVLKKYGFIWFYETLGTEIVHTPLVLLFKVTSQVCPSLYNLFQKWLVNLLTVCDKISLEAENMLYLMLKPTILYSMYCGQTQYPRKEISHRKSQCDSSVLLVDAIVRAPVIEELLYRFLFHHLWLASSRMVGENRKKKSKVIPCDKKACAMPEPWVLPTSVLFGVAHISNWMPLNKSYLADEVAIFLRLVARGDEHEYPMKALKEEKILASVYQAQHAFVMSLMCFVPVYLHRGVVASIAAHSAINLVNSLVQSKNGRYVLALFMLGYHNA